jgi:ABC-2 type transport system ATP-binding protein
MKANIIICLSRKPKYIILDEPTSGLDIAIREEVLDAILKFKNENTTIIFSTHIIEDIEDIASHILLINNGELILNETKEKVISDHNDLDLKKIILNCNIKLN